MPKGQATIAIPASAVLEVRPTLRKSGITDVLRGRALFHANSIIWPACTIDEVVRSGWCGKEE